MLDPWLRAMGLLLVLALVAPGGVRHAPPRIAIESLPGDWRADALADELPFAMRVKHARPIVGAGDVVVAAIVPWCDREPIQLVAAHDATDWLINLLTQTVQAAIDRIERSRTARYCQ